MLRAAEQGRPDVAAKRAAWRAEVMPGLNPRKLVFVDETWANSNRCRRCLTCPGDGTSRMLVTVPYGRVPRLTREEREDHSHGRHAPPVFGVAPTGNARVVALNVGHRGAPLVAVQNRGAPQGDGNDSSGCLRVPGDSGAPRGNPEPARSWSLPPAPRRPHGRPTALFGKGSETPSREGRAVGRATAGTC